MKAIVGTILITVILSLLGTIAIYACWIYFQSWVCGDVYHQILAVILFAAVIYFYNRIIKAMEVF